MDARDVTPGDTLAEFLRAFGVLDLDGMMGCFAPNATAFAPAEHARDRLNDRAAIRAMFAGVIRRVRATGATRLPLDPADVRTQILGEVAVATLHLRGTHLSRRTFILCRTESRWQIVHLHGSNVPLTPSE